MPIMISKDNRSVDATKLRKRAEEIALEKTVLSMENLKAQTPEETWQMLHELRVHQIELEIQNEELMRSQQELEALRNRYFNFYDLSPVGHFTLNEQGLILEVNLTAAKLLGVPKGALDMQPLTRFIFPEDQDIYYRYRIKQIDTDDPQRCELRILKKDDSPFWVRIESNAVRDVDEKHVNRILMSDITESKRAEKVLRNAEARYRLLFEHSPEGVVIIDPETAKINYFNETAHRQLGYTSEEFSQLSIFDLEALEAAEKTSSRIAKVMCEGLSSYETLHRTRNGEIRDIHVTAQTTTDILGRTVYHCIWRDITEQKKVEASLRREQAFSNALIDSMPGIFYLYTYPELRLSRWNKNFETFLGLSSGEIKDRSIMQWFAPDVREEVSQAVETVMEKGHNVLELLILTKDGNQTPFLFTGVKFEDLGRTFLMGVGIDISEQKRAVASLLDSEKKLQAVFNLSPVGLILLNSQGVVLDCSQHFGNIFGVQREKYLGLNLLDSLPKGPVHQNLVDAIAGGKIQYYEGPYTSIVSGKQLHISIISEKITSDLIIAIIMDITDRKLAEEEILDSENRFRAAFFGNPAAVCITTMKDGVWIDANQAELDMFGYTREEVIGKSALKTNLWVDLTDRQRIIDALCRGEKVRNQNVELRHKDGRLIMASVSATALTLKGVKHILYVTENITEQKLAEKALQESNAKHRLLFENANDAIYIVDTEARILSVNQKAATQLGYTHSELMSMTVFQVDSPEGGKRVQERMVMMMEHGHLTFETEHLRKDGSIIPVEVSARRIIWDGKTAIMSICRDITERKVADKTIKTALLEKEILLREIHHRVKNNMQVVCSLLNLQATRSGSEQARQALSESQQRVYVMAMIHEELYSGQNLSTIDFSEYLKRLVNHLQGAYNNKADIQITLELDNIELDNNQAVPCSLIINELITNTFKHAFPARSKGRLQIKLYTINDRDVMLELSDDGIGLPADLDLSNPSTLGLRLVQGLLTKQLKGSLDVVREGGTAFTLRWPLQD